MATQKYWSDDDISGFDFVVCLAHTLRGGLDRNLQSFCQNHQANAELTHFFAWTLIDVGKVTDRLDNSLEFHDFELGTIGVELEHH